MGFTKLFSDIILSSVWSEDDKVRIVWITLLATSNADGFVSGSLPGLAAVARVTLTECEAALEKLSSPDPHSRTKDHEGRRIEAVDGGWLILNYRAYRDRVSDDPNAVAVRDRVRRYRERQRQPLPSDSHPGTAEDREQKQKQGNVTSRYSNGFEEFWKKYPNHTGKVEVWDIWQKVVAPGEAVLLPKILAALDWQTKQQKWLDKGGQYVPNPKTYISNRRWDDEPAKGNRPSTAEEHSKGGWNRAQQPSP